MTEEKKDEKKVEEKKAEELKAEEKKEEKPKEEAKKEEPKKEVKAEKPKAEETEEVEVPKKFKKLVEEIEKMTVLDLAELVKILEKKFGVSAAAPVAVAAAGAPAEAAAEEKDSFNVELSDAGSNKIGVIKVLREITQQGLKECKDMSEGAPVVLKEGVKKEEAEEMKKKLEEAGAKVTLK